jgi:hypothetical protein
MQICGLWHELLGSAKKKLENIKPIGTYGTSKFSNRPYGQTLRRARSARIYGCRKLNVDAENDTVSICFIGSQKSYIHLKFS